MRRLSGCILSLITFAACAGIGHGLPPLPTTVLYAGSSPVPRDPSTSPLLTGVPADTATLPIAESPARLALQPPDFVSAEGLQALALVNEWRVSIDLWPLALNEDLSALAQSQADYLAGLDAWPDNIHEDALGGLSDDRARRIGWPGYDESGQAVAVTEIISTGTFPAEAVDWWRGSEIHTWVIEREYYREAGVGTAQGDFSTLFVIVVGSRPNILPVLLDPVRNEVYLSSERYSGGYNGIIGDVTSVQFLPSSTSPLDPGRWLPWNLSYGVPVDTPPGAVALSDGTQIVIMPIDNMAWLPHTLTP